MTEYTINLYKFFFSSRRRHTRCSRDWSSDVCSSDLSMQKLAPLHLGLQATRIRRFFSTLDAKIRPPVSSAQAKGGEKSETAAFFPRIFRRTPASDILAVVRK